MRRNATGWNSRRSIPPPPSGSTRCSRSARWWPIRSTAASACSAAPTTSWLQVDALHNDPNVDMVLVQEGPPRAPGSDRSETYIRLVNDYVATKATKPIAFTTPISLGRTDYSRDLRANAPHVSFLEEAFKTVRAVASAARRERTRAACRQRGAAAAADAVSAHHHRARAQPRHRRGRCARRGRIQERAACLRHRDAGRDPGDVGGGGREGGRAHRLSGGAQGGVGRRSRTSPTPARSRSIWRRRSS